MQPQQPSEEEEIKVGYLLRREGGLIGTTTVWRQRWFVLSGRTLYWFKTEEEAIKSSSKKKKGARGYAELVGAKVRVYPNLDPPINDIPASKEDGCFQIVPAQGSVITCCWNKQEVAANWIELIQGVIEGRTDLSRDTVSIEEELRRAGHNIPPEDLEFNDTVVGSGASGVVKLGTWMGTTRVAIKTLQNLPEFTDAREMKQFFKEIETLSKLRHQNIVQMLGFCRKDNTLCLVTEFFGQGSLSDCLKDPEKYPLDFPLQVELAMAICRGLQYLHKVDVIHRDLKPANILIESWVDAKIKVCDFGISRVVKKSVSATADDDAMGSPQYAAPELVNPNHNSKVDVFSYAIILWEIAMRETPWPEVKFGWQFSERYLAGDRPDVPASCPFKPLICSCWAGNPTLRPDFSRIYTDLDRIKQGETIVSSHESQPMVGRTLGQRPGSQIFSGTFGGANRALSPPPGKAPPTKFARTQQPHYAPLPKPGVYSLTPSRLGSPATGRMVVGSPPRSLSVSRINTSPSRLPVPPPNGGLPLRPTPNARPPPTRFGSTTNLNTITPPHTPPGTPTLSRPNPLPLNPNELPISNLFASKPAETWAEFARTFTVAMGCRLEEVEALRHVLDTQGGNVEKTTWDSFLQWFTPLSVSDLYQSGPSTHVDTGGYEMDMITDICSPLWFHGFLDSKDAQTILKGKPEGVYLVRFSSEPGSYTLTVAYAGTVGHWRISCVKQPNAKPFFRMDGREYKSLHDLLLVHSRTLPTSEPLKIKNTKAGVSSCWLTSPLTRKGPEENFYQAV